MRVEQSKIPSAISKILDKEENIVFAYIFGSVLTDRFTENSDVDIAVYQKNIDKSEYLSIHHDIAKTIGRDVDIVFLNSLHNISLMNSILTSNSIIKDSDIDSRLFYETLIEHKIKDYIAFKRYLNAG